MTSSHMKVILSSYSYNNTGHCCCCLCVVTADSRGHPKPLVSIAMAHSRPVTHMAFLEDRYVGGWVGWVGVDK